MCPGTHSGLFHLDAQRVRSVVGLPVRPCWSWGSDRYDMHSRVTPVLAGLRGQAWFDVPASFQVAFYHEQAGWTESRESAKPIININH